MPCWGGLVCGLRFLGFCFGFISCGFGSDFGIGGVLLRVWCLLLSFGFVRWWLLFCFVLFCG